jgi:hypothetical protein
MARQHPPQVMGVGRADPVDGVAAGGEEHRDRQPGGPGRFHDHLKQGARGGLGQRGPLHLAETVHRRDRLAAADQAAVARKHPDGVGAGDPKVDPDQPSVVHLVASVAVVACWAAASLGRRWVTATVPRALCPTTAPTHVLQPGPDPAGSGHFPHPGHPWPAKGGNQTNEARRTSAFLRGGLNATPGTSRDAHATLGPWWDQAPRSLT